MHFLYKILAERHEEKNSEKSSQSRTQEHLPEIDVKTENINSRQGKDSAGHNHTGTCADALDNDILPKAAFLSQSPCHAHCNDGNRDSGFKNLSNLQTEKCCCCRKKNSHQQAENHRIRGDFEWLLVRAQERFVRFARFQFPMCVLGKTQIFVLFHLYLSVFDRIQYTCQELLFL